MPQEVITLPCGFTSPARVVIDNGAYVSWGSTTPYVMLATTAGLYRVPAVRFDTTIVYTNNPY